MKDKIRIVVWGYRKKSLLKYPDLVRQCPHIVTEAVDEQMVWTLLNLELPTQLTHVLAPGSSLDERSKLAADDMHSKLVASNVKSCFPYLTTKWQKVAQTLLDHCIFMEGHSARDPNLVVDLSLELFVSKSRNDRFNFKSLLTLVNDPENYMPILNHTVVKTFVAKFETKNIFRRFLYLGMAVFMLIELTSNMYSDVREKVCPNFKTFVYREIVWRTAFLVCWGIYVMIELVQLVEFRQKYFKDSYNLFQWVVIIVTPISLLNSPLGGASDYIIITSINLLWTNLIFSLRNTRILGKYILMFLEVCLTFAKLMLPFGFFLFLMAVCLFTVYYFVALAEQVVTVQNKNVDLAIECWANYSYDAGDGLVNSDHPLDKDMPSDWDAEYLVKLMLQAFDLLNGNTNVAQGTEVENIVEPLNASCWAFATIFAAVLLANLLVGLTVRDVDYIAKLADMKIVALEIQQIFESTARYALVLTPVRLCFGNKPVKNIIRITPNRRERTYWEVFQDVISMFLPAYVLERKNINNELRELARERFSK